MPHILLSGYDGEKVIKQMNLHLDIQFSPEYHKSLKHYERLKEFEQKLSGFMSEYFADYECETYTNHEYNTRMGK